MYLRLYIIILLFALFNLHSANSQLKYQKEKREINLLVLHSFDNKLPDYCEFNRLLKENLKRENILANIHVFYLDCDAYGSVDEIARMYNLVDTLSTKPDIILVNDDQATFSLLATNHPLVKTIPIVFTGVNFPNWDLLKRYSNVTGMWDELDYVKNMQMIEELQGVKRIRFFYDKTYSLLRLLIILVISYLLFLYLREARRKRQAQLKLREEKEFLSLAIEVGRIFAWKYDHDEDEFTYDDEFLLELGLTTRTIKLKEMIEMTHPDELEHTLTTFINVVNRVEVRSETRVRIDFNGNGYVWYEFRFLNVSGVLGDKSAIIGLVMDIQDYKSKEEELIAARDLASKAELKQSFLANMSHEIRTPLNAIVGFSNILVADEELDSEDKIEYISIINKNCELLLKLINDILEISRIESGNMSFSFQSCNLNEVVGDVYKMCQLQAPVGIRFIKHIPEKPILVDMDIMRLKQVIVNLISNAFKFTTIGYVSVGIEHDLSKNEVIIYVEDTGAGISEEHQKLIFDRFYKIDEFAQGTGLGLSICQVIIDRLHGHISLSSEVGKGSRFEIILSYDKKPEISPTDFDDEREAGIVENFNKLGEEMPVVLIAEDSVSNYMVLNSILKKSYNIIWAINGKDALDIVKKQKVDIVLMDIRMQEMDGITALKKIRKNFKKLPVIIQTAYAFDESLQLAQDAGASAFLTKPIRAEELLKIMGDLTVTDTDNRKNG